MSASHSINIDKIRRQLRDFAAAASNAPDLVWEDGTIRDSIDRNLFPVSTLILYVLNGICDFPRGYRSEKTHWIVPFTYRGANCAISSEKFGLSLYRSRDKDVDEKELLGKLRKAVEFTEKHILADVALEQIRSGNITIINQFHWFRNQYAYFRKCANSAFFPHPSDIGTHDVKDFSRSLTLSFQNVAEGSYNALAMIDTYFSRLEHLLVLALPFCSFKRSQDDISSYIRKNWSEKAKRILNINSPPMQEYYNRLVTVKEKYRNTFAHGGFEKKGASFYFHLPSFGAIPASMSGYKNSVHFNLFPIEPHSFKEICGWFDEFDEWLSSTDLKMAWKYAESGLDLHFDDESIADIEKAILDPDSFEAWIMRKQLIAEMYMNADY